MEKIYIGMILVIMSFILYGCSSKAEYLQKELDEQTEITNKVLEEFIGALENGDKEAIKEMFSKQALDEIENLDDLDKQIEDAINFYQGTMEKYEGNCSYEEKNRHGQKEIECFPRYIITTTKITYEVYFIFTSRNDENSDNIGLYSWEIATEEAKKKPGFKWKTRSGGAGVRVYE